MKNIGPYTYDAFKEKVAAFHGYPAPGVIIGGYMVALAQEKIPEDVLFDAIVETPKCLPDAVQLLTLCSYGNGWMKVFPFGRYALSLYNKYTGEGVRVRIDPDRLKAWPHIEMWLFKTQPKKEQNSDALFQEIAEAGADICGVAPVQVKEDAMKRFSFGDIGRCRECGEPHPVKFGEVCKACAGESPYL